MTILAFLLLSTLGAAEDGRPEFVEDFRNRPVADFSPQLENQAYTAVLKSESEGLRITLPGDKRYNQIVGLLAPTPVIGDFEITTAYEILDAKRPTAGGFGVGFELYIRAHGRLADGVAFLRLTRDSGKEVYSISHLRNDENNRRVPGPGSVKGIRDFPAQNKIGQLRMTRIGSKLSLSAADDLGLNFKTMYEIDFGAEDLSVVRVGAQPGNAPNPVDIRIIELRVKPLNAARQDSVKADEKLQDLTKAIDTMTTPKATGETPEPRRTWLWVIALLAALSFVIGTVIVVLIGKRYRARSTESESANEPDADRPPPAVLAQCAGCGKKLKVRAELAGKKVKCSQCGQVLVVPTNA